MPGSALLAALSHSIAGLNNADVVDSPPGAFLQVSAGLRFDWHLKSGVPAVAHAYVREEATGAFVRVNATRCPRFSSACKADTKSCRSLGVRMHDRAPSRCFVRT